jgi:hypothetical protein
MAGVEGCRPTHGVNVVAAEIRTPDDVDGAFEAPASERLDVVIVLQTSMLLSECEKIAHVWQRLAPHPNSTIFPM